MFKKFGLACSLLLSMILATPAMAADGDHTIYLLRHAENINGQADGALTGNGKRRAANIAAILIDAGVERVYSTDYNRTQGTAAPLADALDMDVESYDPYFMPEFAESLKAQNGVSVVVGHSNTTPYMVYLLGGDPGTDIDHDEYSRLYQLTIDADGTVKTVLLRSIAD